MKMCIYMLYIYKQILKHLDFFKRMFVNRQLFSIITNIIYVFHGVHGISMVFMIKKLNVVIRFFASSLVSFLTYCFQTMC